MQYQNILFDADNTLFDFAGSSKLAFKDLILAYGFDFSDSLYANYKKWNHQVWDEFEKGTINSIDLRAKRFQLFFDDNDIIRDARQANDDYLNNLVKHASLIDGALTLLEDLKEQGLKMSIITNGLKEVQKPRIRKVNLEHFFEEIIVSDEIGVAKPQKGFFDFTANALGQPMKSQTLVVGDSLSSDIKGGNNYGYATCWYNPNSLVNTSDVSPTYEVNNYDHIKAILKK